MDFDLLIPKNNEAELLKRARELGWKKVIFLYENQVASTLPKDSEAGILIRPKSKKDLLKAIKKKGLTVAISDGSENINRMILETKGIDYVFNLSTASGRDHTHYRRGGVNQVLAKLAKENNISYGLSFSRYLKERQRILLLGRWMFNAKIFKKYGVPIEIFSMASNPEGIRSKDSLASFLALI